MSPSAYVTKRATKSGARFVVRYRLGGRFTALVHAGSFKTRRDAETRRQFVIAELAAGRDPRVSLQELQAPATPTRTLRDDFGDWIASRRDAAPASLGVWRSAFRKMPDGLLDQQTSAVTWREVADVFADLELSPSSLRDYRGALAQVFDFADVVPNPVRDRRFRLPPREAIEPVPPPADHVLAMLERISYRMTLPFVLLEQTGARVEEVAGLPWGDVDVIGNRVRVTRTRAKTRRGRWLQVQPEIMTLIADQLPPEDRSSERSVFDFTAAGLRSAMQRACVAAQIPHYHPHDLRHRRISLWHGQGLPWREIADRVGQSKASITLDVYSHVMTPDELPLELLVAAVVRSR